MIIFTLLKGLRKSINTEFCSWYKYYVNQGRKRNWQWSGICMNACNEMKPYPSKGSWIKNYNRNIIICRARMTRTGMYWRWRWYPAFVIIVFCSIMMWYFQRLKVFLVDYKLLYRGYNMFTIIVREIAIFPHTQMRSK